MTTAAKKRKKESCKEFDFIPLIPVPEIFQKKVRGPCQEQLADQKGQPLTQACLIQSWPDPKPC